MLDVIILTKTSTPQHLAMVERCVRSYLQDGDEFINSIILMESDKAADLKHWSTISSKIKVVVPQYKFNYNLFLNIALEHCTADFICISNNDVVTKPGCVKTMLAIFHKVPTLMSASPVDRSWHLNSYQEFPQDNNIYPGYQTSKHLLGFCIFARKQVYDISGKFDERFHFYHQDNDYERCLINNNLTHALVTFAHIEHGLDKPESEEDGVEIRRKLLDSQKTFNEKWSSSPYIERVVKYRRLSIVTNVDITPVNDLVEIVHNIAEVTGRHVMMVDADVTAEQQQQLLDVLAYVPDKVIISGYNIIRRF